MERKSGKMPDFFVGLDIYYHGISVISSKRTMQSSVAV
jgi:hypothetical protein